MDSKSKEIEKKYEETLNWLYAQLPMFSRIGAAAYKPGLETSIELDEFLGSPHQQFRSIHIAGTNGKGSTSHMIASMLQAQGYKTALYTSPHLIDFRERMKINGQMIPKEEVVAFIEKWRKSTFKRNPSFFELTMMMAFDWFAKEKVDYAVIEVGMGGRLDSTNIITPLLSIITNISFDHTQFLGDTLEKIAGEKAGIIKKGIPAVIGEVSSLRKVFEDRAKEVDTELIFAEETNDIISAEWQPEGWKIKTDDFGVLEIPLGGDYQLKNIGTVLAGVKKLKEQGVKIDSESIIAGLKDVIKNTGLAGRWQILNKSPLTICDTGHNEAGLRYNMAQLKKIRAKKSGTLRMLIGFVNDKDVEHIAALFPKDATYYFSQASIPRAMPVECVAEIFGKHGIKGREYKTVEEAYNAIVNESQEDDLIYIGGSTFIVADLLGVIKMHNV